MSSDAKVIPTLLNTQPISQSLNGISFGLGGFALLLGFIGAISVMSGDLEGRVNLLYLLLLFAFLPALGLLLSVFFVLGRHPRGLAGWLLTLPWWPRNWLQQSRQLPTAKLRKAWLFYLTQVLALGFGLGCLGAFFILLIGTDMSFVWRSTLIEASELYPVLNGLAWPWRFWAEAQPSLELLQLSQDFRLAEQQNTAIQLGVWWTYAFAALCAYNLLPRGVLLLWARWHFLKLQRVAHEEARMQSRIDAPLNSVPMQGRLAALVNTVSGPYVLVDWAQSPAWLQAHLALPLGTPAQTCKADALASVEAVEQLRGHGSIQVVVLVKGWEAPLGELRDYLQQLQVSSTLPGLLLPLDWDDGRLLEISAVHRQEWRRFAGELTHWQVLQLVEPSAPGVSS